MYLLVLLLVTLASSIPIQDFFPFNGEKVCMIDSTTGLVHTSNMIDGFGVSITNLNPSECFEFRLSPNDDASSQNIGISTSFTFFNKRFRNVFVST